MDEPFARGDTFLHRADPRAKIVAAAALSMTVAAAQGPAGPGAALALTLGLALWARLPARAALRRALSVNAFIAFLWLFLPFTQPGTPAFQVGPLTATDQGLALAGLITVKCNAILLAFLALLATSDAASLGQAMDRLGAPSKLVFLFLFTYRFIHVLADEYGRLVVAARLRGFRARTSAHTYRTLASLLAMVLVGAMRRAEMVRQAMLLRGFQGRFASLRVFRMGRAEQAFLVGMLSLTAGLAALEVLSAVP